MRRFRRLVFQLERFILRGAPFQLLLIAVLLLLVSLLAGGILFLVHPADGSLGEWVWWGFLRLSDPGYLGDDAGLARRTVSVVVTILGYVLFMGALVAIMTQGLYRTISRLESGLTPLTKSGHIIILGWTNRTPSIVREILLAQGRVKRFLRRVGTGSLNIVILAENVTASLVTDLKDELGPAWHADKIIFRSGNPLRLEHLARVDFLNAAAIILPASDVEVERADAFDSKVMKILMVISNTALAQQPPRQPPLVVAEIFDPRKAELARGSYQGGVEIVPSSSIISRLIAQNVRHAGLSHVYRELLTHGTGSELYVRDCPEVAGLPFGALAELFPEAVPLGVLREEAGGLVPHLNPPADFRVDRDRLVFMAHSYAGTTPARKKAPSTPVAAVPGQPRPVGPDGKSRRVLIMGWGSKLPVLLAEFDSYARERFAIDLMSIKPIEERELFLKRFGQELRNVSVNHIDGDFTSPAGLADVSLTDYTNIVFLASDWMTSESESDARTILGYQLLRSELGKRPHEKQPQVLIELMDPENEPLFKARAGEVLVSPVIVSHMMGHIALRPDLSQVFEELFTAGGAEIFFHDPAVYLEPHESRLAFGELQRRSAARGDIALGLFRGRKENGDGAETLLLNPARETAWEFCAGDEIVVLTTYA